MIQFITHTNERYDYIDGVRMALEGGCRWIQLRMKDASEEEVLKTAKVRENYADNTMQSLFLMIM